MQDTKCGDCQNPLVQVMPFQIGGDIPIFDKDPAWERLKNGELDFSDNWWRGMEFATNFIKKTHVRISITKWIIPILTVIRLFMWGLWEKQNMK